MLADVLVPVLGRDPDELRTQVCTGPAGHCDEVPSRYAVAGRERVYPEDQIVIAAEVTVASPDFGHLEPMIRATEHELRRAGIEQQPYVVLADAGYWHQVQMERLLGDGRTVLIPPDAKERAGARPGWDGGLYALMRRVLDTDAGRALYARRQTMIEPILPTPSSTAASTASYAAADPPPDPNGASPTPPTTSSSSGGTPAPPRPPDGPPPPRTTRSLFITPTAHVSAETPRATTFRNSLREKEARSELRTRRTLLVLEGPLAAPRGRRLTSKAAATTTPIRHVRVGDELSAKGFIHHVDLAVTDVERSLAFYRDLLEPLGWTDTVRYPTYRGSEEVVYLQHPATKCGLGIRPADSDGYQYYGVGIEHLAFEVDEREEVDAAHARCAERGDNIHFPPEEDRDIGGYYAFFVFDPDGMRIEIFSWPR